MKTIQLHMGIPSIEAEEAAASLLSEQVAHVPIASLLSPAPHYCLHTWFKGHVCGQESGGHNRSIIVGIW